MYAVIETGGKQYRVSEGDLIEVEKIDGEKGVIVSFGALMVAEEGDIRIGRPIVEGAVVRGEIVDHPRGPKITVFKMKRRKGFRKKTGHRQNLTCLRIKEISI
ncbi:MAG TPA: 50S ribosomal protein L21 [Syntrophales bacterium]|nr:50S ribosomal protein L21 [Syntrophobacterales bacterium]HRR41107.1 50S ribosomal protein L21 [Syntrophales bacterium]HRT27223.1 50S ribosomal protein L21 [Syntrophales bacterium]HRT69761.1 50S ribosomal protein L21 [Syntrophales bacterium]